jgi:hypothetical protein
MVFICGAYYHRSRVRRSRRVGLLRILEGLMDTEHHCPFLNHEELIIELLRLRSLDRKRKEICEISEHDERRLKAICSRASQKLAELLVSLRARAGAETNLLDEVQRVVETLAKC